MCCWQPSNGRFTKSRQWVCCVHEHIPSQNIGDLYCSGDTLNTAPKSNHSCRLSTTASHLHCHSRVINSLSDCTGIYDIDRGTREDRRKLSEPLAFLRLGVVTRVRCTWCCYPPSLHFRIHSAMLASPANDTLRSVHSAYTGTVFVFES